MAIAVVAGLLLAVGQSTAAEAPARSGFVAQAQAAGLSDGQAAALQNKVDGYLTELGDKGTQVSPNQIDMGGAVLNVTVPGESQPRQLVRAGRAEYQVAACDDYWALDGWFCAYRGQWGTGDVIGMYTCDNYFIPWRGEGSWMNNQTPGTAPTLHWVDSMRPPWKMPAAFSMQGYHVDWAPVHSITNC
ncbi:hypothetical protein [Streptomyces capillispiralis]|uniref:Peptidase inhibitor family I36 n=1 Tax=Streptomyces capillispiralis TaxID=68182 RepID=A0A561TRL4_9ACTN|nr:hypothetical protein [Streptomyces capillispiralis]TWF89753.1 hypothetical protein FHX78_116796 [Streptomyces capillispiralis]GHH94076.1 hypothetical protein GCM10017779_45330 [Streptomyces capillispiralis]